MEQFSTDKQGGKRSKIPSWFYNLPYCFEQSLNETYFCI